MGRDGWTAGRRAHVEREWTLQSGGEKLSALDIERSLLELEYITDTAVVGVPSEEWGQLVRGADGCVRPLS